MADTASGFNKVTRWFGLKSSGLKCSEHTKLYSTILHQHFVLMTYCGLFGTS